MIFFQGCYKCEPWRYSQVKIYKTVHPSYDTTYFKLEKTLKEGKKNKIKAKSVQG